MILQSLSVQKLPPAQFIHTSLSHPIPRLKRDKMIIHTQMNQSQINPLPLSLSLSNSNINDATLAYEDGTQVRHKRSSSHQPVYIVSFHDHLHKCDIKKLKGLGSNRQAKKRVLLVRFGCNLAELLRDST